MRELNITGISLDEARRKKTETDWDRLRVSDDASDDADFEVDWTKAKLVEPEPKKMISLRLDADVLEYFRNQGKGYQTRMNAILRAYKEAHEKAS